MAAAPDDPTDPTPVGGANLGNGGSPGTETLAGGPDARTGRGRFPAVAAVITALVLVVASGTAVVAYRTLSGGGPQPERYAPASTFAFAKVDLDPGAGTKVAAYRFARKFPSELTDGIRSGDDLRDRLLRDVFEDFGDDTPVDYESDVEPWLGSRAGVAAFTDGDGEPQVVVILRVDDHDEASEALPRLKDGHPDRAYALRTDYAILGGDQAAVDTAVAAADEADLTTSEAFRDDMDALGGGSLASAWVDLPAAAEALGDVFPAELLAGGLGSFGALNPLLFGAFGTFGVAPGTPEAFDSDLDIEYAEPPSTTCRREMRRAARTWTPEAGGSPWDEISPRCRRQLGLPETPTLRPSGMAMRRSLRAPSAETATTEDVTGRLALAVHIDADYVELVTRAVGVRSSEVSTDVREQVGALPDDTVAALAVGEVHASLSEYADGSGGSERELVDDLLGEVDLNLDRVVDAFGDTVVLALGEVPADGASPLVALRTRPTDPDAATVLVEQLNELLVEEGEPPLAVRRGEDLIVATDGAYADAVATGGDLGGQDRFTTAVGPLAGTVSAVGYVDLRAILGTLDDQGGDAKALTAAGFSVTSDGEVDLVRLRVVAD